MKKNEKKCIQCLTPNSTCPILPISTNWRMRMTRAQQKQIGYEMGKKAYSNAFYVPAFNPEYAAMLEGKKIGEMKSFELAYYKGFTEAKLNDGILAA